MQDKVYEGKRQPKVSSAAMKRTLFIGIGGTGKEVLMRLRRKFFSMTENKYGHEFIRYLWIDTDVDGPAICDENWAVIGEGISFGVRDSVNEVFNASVDRDTLSQFYDRINTFPHIRHWFPEDALRPLGYNALLNGAKGIRPLGRLAFAWHSSDILSIIQENIGKIDVNSFTESNLDNNIDIYVVGSLAGGTGSGMFLEIAKLLKANWPTNSVYGVFFLSDMFTAVGDNQYRDANCYAALQELDFYQNAGNMGDPLISKERHLFEFVDSSGGAKSFNLPLYNNVFLVTNEYFKSPAEATFSDPFEMVAEIFYYDFDNSDFGSLKRSRTVNSTICGSQASVVYIQKDNRNNKDIAVESTYPSDYSAFSLAGIFLNLNKMKIWGAYKYICDLLKKLESKKQGSPNLYQNPDGSFSIRWLNLEDMLRKITNGTSNDSLGESYIKRLKQRHQKTLNDLYSKIKFDHYSVGSVQKVCHEIFQEIDRFISDEDGNARSALTTFKSVHGEILAELNNNLEIGIAKLYAEIEELMYSILANIELGGVSTAKAMLELVKAKITQMETSYDNYMNDIRRRKHSVADKKSPEHPEIKIDSSISDLLQRIEDCNEIPLLFPLYKNKAKKFYDRHLSREIDKMNRELMAQVRLYFEECLSLLLERFQVEFDETAGTLIKRFRQLTIELVDSVEVSLANGTQAPGMIQQLNWYQGNLSDLYNHFRGFEISLGAAISQQISRKLVLDDSMEKESQYKNFLAMQGGDQWFTSALSDLYKQHLDLYHPVNMDINDEMQKFVRTLVFYKKITGSSIPNLKEAMKEISRSKFDSFNRSVSVTDQLHAALQNDPAGVKNKVKKMLDNFTIRLALSQSYPNIRARVERTTDNNRLVGLPAPHSEIEDLLKTSGQVSNVNYHGSQESILFYSETFGYPLFMLKNISNLKYALDLNMKESGNNIYHRYSDIVTDYLRPLVIPQNVEDMKSILHSWEILYEAITLRVIEYKDKTWKATLEDPNRHNIRETIELGKTLESATYKLNSNPDLRNLVKHKISDVFALELNNKESIEQIWFALYDNYQGVNEYVGSQFDTNRPITPQEYVLETLLNKYLEKYMQLTGDTDVHNVEVALSQEYRDVIMISSGYKDATHQNGLKVIPN